jgi:hypothetical protein
VTGWGEQAPALLLALAYLVVPGLPTALCLRGVPGVVRLAAAVGSSLGIIAAASVLAPVVGLRWGVLPVVGVAVVVSVIAGALRLSDRRPTPEAANTTSRKPWVWAGLAVAFLGWVALLVLGMRDPGNPSQLYDGLFHLNAVEFILDAGDASPLHMTMVTPGQTTSFYPTLWHALVSLLVPLSGGVVAATNVATIAVIALIWPVALAALTTVVFPDRPLAAAFAPVLGWGFSVFPLGFLNWGVLYPNLIGTVLIPLVLASVLLACAPGLSWQRRTLRVLVALAVAGGTALGHPSALLGGVALLVPFAVWRAWGVVRRSTATARVVVIALIGLALAGLLVVWGAANVTTHEWLPTQTIAQSVGEVAFLSPVGRSTGLLLGPLVAIGIWYLARRRVWWVLGSYAVSIALYLAAAWLPVLALRSFFVGVWYDDTTRVAALLAVWGLPLAAVGISVVGDWIAQLHRRRRRGVLVAVIALLALAAGSHLLAVRNDLRYLRDVSYRFDEQSQGLSPDEAALFERAERELGPNSLVVGDPLTGAGLLYAYTGHDVVFPHVTGRYGPESAVLARSLVTGDAAACEAIEDLGVTHAVDFGDTVLFQNHYTTYDGLHDLDESPILTEVDRVGDAVLYEITGCD